MPASADNLHANAAERYQPLVLLLAALAGGMVLDRYAPLAAQEWAAICATLLLLWSAFWLAEQFVPATLLLLGSLLALGGGWHHDRWRLYEADEIGQFAREETQPVMVEAIALTSPRLVPAPTYTALRSIPKGDHTELLVRLRRVRNGRNWQPAAGTASLDVDGHLVGIRAGDRLQIGALATRPPGPLNPGEFDFAAHQRSRRILCRLRGLFPENVALLEQGTDWNWRHWLGIVRDAGNLQFRRHVGSSRTGLAAAILLGAREQLDPEKNEGFLVTGTVHVLSISGVHVGILAWGLWVVARTGLLPRTSALISVMLFVTFYALLTDAQPPVVRAAVLIVVLCLARLWGRRALGFNSLAAAGLVVLAFDPLSLFHVGTQLSFLAVAGMILFRHWLTQKPIHDPLDRLIAQTRPWYVRWGKHAAQDTWRVCLTGGIIWLLALPLVWKQYNLLSPVGLAMNPIVWIPITIALFSGFGVLMFGWLVPPLGALCGAICDANLALIEWSIDLGRFAPGSFFWLPAPPWWWIGVFYAAVTHFALLPPLRPSGRWCAALMLMWLAGAATFASNWHARRQTPGDKPLVCTFVAVGHGTGCILELPDGRVVVYDAGRLGSPMAAARPMSCALWSRGIRRIDAAIISHADADHYNALPELLDRFRTDAVYVSPFMFQRPIAALQELKAAIATKAPMLQLAAGDRLKAHPEVKLEVLHPPKSGVGGNDNARSIVLLVEYAGRRILLPGDLESPGLDDLLAELPVDCDIVMAPHHGSTRSNPRGFAAWSRPDFAVISGPRDPDDARDTAAVKLAYRQAGADVFHTAEDGAIEFIIDREGYIHCRTFRGGKQKTLKPFVEL